MCVSHHKTKNSMNKKDNMSPTTIRISIIILPEKSYLADTKDNEFKKQLQSIQGTQRGYE